MKSRDANGDTIWLFVALFGLCAVIRLLTSAILLMSLTLNAVFIYTMMVHFRRQRIELPRIISKEIYKKP